VVTESLLFAPRLPDDAPDATSLLLEVEAPFFFLTLLNDLFPPFVPLATNLVPLLESESGDLLSQIFPLPLLLLFSLRSPFNCLFPFPLLLLLPLLILPILPLYLPLLMLLLALLPPLLLLTVPPLSFPLLLLLAMLVPLLLLLHSSSIGGFVGVTGGGADSGAFVDLACGALVGAMGGSMGSISVGGFVGMPLGAFEKVGLSLGKEDNGGIVLMVGEFEIAGVSLGKEEPKGMEVGAVELVGESLGKEDTNGIVLNVGEFDLVGMLLGKEDTDGIVVMVGAGLGNPSTASMASTKTTLEKTSVSSDFSSKMNLSLLLLTKFGRIL